MSKPLVSVVIPIYNMQDFLAQTVDAVLASAYDSFEVILMDDGSTDCSAQIAQEYALKDARVKYYKQANAGASAARNHAIRLAKGDFILPVDADNLISTDFIEKAASILLQQPSVKVVSTEAEFIGDKSGRWKLPAFSLGLLARKNLIDNCAMYRKADWEKVGGYCEEILGREDWDFWIAMLKSGGDMIRLPIVGLYYRVHKNSKRKRTRHLKKVIIDSLNERHTDFFNEQLGGRLHYSRTWSRFFNFFIRNFSLNKIFY